MISSAIWDKSAQANFSKVHQTVQARRANANYCLRKTFTC